MAGSGGARTWLGLAAVVAAGAGMVATRSPHKPDLLFWME